MTRAEFQLDSMRSSVQQSLSDSSRVLEKLFWAVKHLEHPEQRQRVKFVYPGSQIQWLRGGFFTKAIEFSTHPSAPPSNAMISNILVC